MRFATLLLAAGLATLLAAGLATPLAAGLATLPATTRAQAAQTPAVAADLVTQAYDAAFNLDHERALQLARELVSQAPDDSRSHRLLATILWTNILFRMGAVSVDYFLGSFTKSKDTRPEIPAEIEQEFTTALARAIELAEARFTQRRNDVDAMYELGAAYGIQATFRASMEGGVTAAFGSARKAFGTEEDVLERDANHLGANIIVGTYRYIVSTLRFPSRWLAYLVGFGGGKDQGIAMIERTAREPVGVVDAVPALLLIYTREERYGEALAMAERLSQAFPRNRLFSLEVAAAALRAGQAERADQLLTKGIQSLDADPRPRVPGERALWLYKRGAARVELERRADARLDIEEALASMPAGWIRGRLHIELGKLADLEGRRAEAREAYALAKDIARRNDDPAARAEADALLKRPFEPGSRAIRRVTVSRPAAVEKRAGAETRRSR